MGYTSVIKERAIQLRMAGKSYTQILKELELRSKGTLSVWFRDVKLPSKAQRLLEKNNERAAKRGFFKFNRDRTERIRKENRAAYLNGMRLIGTLTPRELLIAGAALFWGEGTKWERLNGSLALVFTNSDPAMIKVFLRFVRTILKVEDERIRAGIHLYDREKIVPSKVFWSRVTKLPTDRFYTSLLVSGASSKKRDKKRLPYGTLVIRINNRILFYKLKGMVAGLVAEKIS